MDSAKFRPCDSPLGDRLWPPVNELRKLGSRLFDGMYPSQLSLLSKCSYWDELPAADFEVPRGRCGSVLYMSVAW